VLPIGSDGPQNGAGIFRRVDDLARLLLRLFLRANNEGEDAPCHSAKLRLAIHTYAVRDLLAARSGFAGANANLAAPILQCFLGAGRVAAVCAIDRGGAQAFAPISPAVIFGNSTFD